MSQNDTSGPLVKRAKSKPSGINPPFSLVESDEFLEVIQDIIDLHNELILNLDFSDKANLSKAFNLLQLSEKMGVPSEHVEYWVENGSPSEDVWRIISQYHDKLLRLKEEKDFSSSQIFSDEGTHEELKFADDFSYVEYDGKVLCKFSSRQADAIHIMHEWQKTHKFITKENLKEQLQVNEDRTSPWRLEKDIFKNHELWGKLIVKGERPSTYLLNLKWKP